MSAYSTICTVEHYSEVISVLLVCGLLQRRASELKKMCELDHLARKS